MTVLIFMSVAFIYVNRAVNIHIPINIIPPAITIASEIEQLTNDIATIDEDIKRLDTMYQNTRYINGGSVSIIINIKPKYQVVVMMIDDAIKKAKFRMLFRGAASDRIEEKVTTNVMKPINMTYRYL